MKWEEMKALSLDFWMENRFQHGTKQDDMWVRDPVLLWWWQLCWENLLVSWSGEVLVVVLGGEWLVDPTVVGWDALRIELLWWA